MKRYILNLCLFILPLNISTIFAQNTEVTSKESTADNSVISLKYCENYDDFIANNWKTVDSIKIITKSRSKQF